MRIYKLQQGQQFTIIGAESFGPLIFNGMDGMYAKVIKNGKQANIHCGTEVEVYNG